MRIRWTIAILIVALSGAYATKLRLARAEAGPAPRLGELTRSIGDWTGEDVVVTDRTDDILRPDATLRRRYREKNGAEVRLFVAYFSQQKVDKQIHSPKNCIPGGGWNVASVEETRLRMTDEDRNVTRMVVRRRDQTQEVLYWIRTQGGVIGDEYGLKWDLVKQGLRGRPTNAALVRYNASQSDSTRMRDLISLLDGPLTQVLATAGLK